MTVIDDFVAETLRLQGILGLLTPAQWQAESGAGGWSVADVVLHLAQSDESVAASADGADHRARRRGGHRRRLGGAHGGGRTDRARPGLRPLARGARHRRGSAPGGRPGAPLQWVAGPVKPATLTTTRLAEYWAHGLDITEPLGLDFPDTDRLRHIAWLAHRTLPYALSRAGQRPRRCAAR